MEPDPGEEVDRELARELHDTLIKLIELNNKKFLCAFRTGGNRRAKLKKNQEKLITVLYFGGQATPSELSRRIVLEKGSLTTLLDSLEAIGFVNRVQAPGDRRKTLVSLTGQGRTYMEKVRAEHLEILLNLLKKCSRSEVEELIVHLRRAVEIIERL